MHVIHLNLLELYTFKSTVSVKDIVCYFALTLICDLVFNVILLVKVEF